MMPRRKPPFAAASPLSINLTGGVFVNQTAAFSDYHGTSANPAANAALSDAAFAKSARHVSKVCDVTTGDDS